MDKQTSDQQYNRMTQTPVHSLVIQLCIPTVISMLVTNIYNMVDTAFVGKLGNSASGAVGVVFGFMAILQAVGFLFGQGAGSIASRQLGQKEREAAGVTASTGFFLAFGSGILIAVASFFFLRPLVMLLGSTETIAPYAEEYICYILLAAPFMTSSLVLNNLLRYEGKAALGMIGLMAGSVLNIFGDAFFMFHMGMGVAGAGLSTALSQTVSFFILLSVFLMKKTQCSLSVRRFSCSGRNILDIIATGMPSLLRQGLASLSTVVLNGQAGVYGDAAIAAMSVVSRIVMFVFSVVVGIGQGFRPVSAFNYGAKSSAPPVPCHLLSALQHGDGDAAPEHRTEAERIPALRHAQRPVSHSRPAHSGKAPGPCRNSGGPAAGVCGLLRDRHFLCPLVFPAAAKGK